MWFLTSLWSATLCVTHSCLWSSLWSSDLSVFSSLQPNLCHCLARNNETSRLENASDRTKRQGVRLYCSVNCSLQIQRVWDWEMCVYIHTWKHSVIQEKKEIRHKPVTSTKKWIASSQVNNSHFLRFIASEHWALKPQDPVSCDEYDPLLCYVFVSVEKEHKHFSSPCVFRSVRGKWSLCSY